MKDLPLVLFDGVCNLCNGTVAFIIKKDSNKQFRFAALQSKTGKKSGEKYNIPSEIDSIILIYKNHIFYKSDAVLEIAGLLPFPWKLASMFKIIPKKMRNKMYQWIAKNRYIWFGKKESCRLPGPEEKLFFPEYDDLKF